MEKKRTAPTCHCGAAATWMRKTQFAGDHYFCTQDAKKEPDFRKEKRDDTFFWAKM